MTKVKLTKQVFTEISDAAALSMLLGGAANPGGGSGNDPGGSNHPINNVLQQYTQHILKMVEEKISQAKPDPGAK